jgi:PAS domain S-box-containing protein
MEDNSVARYRALFETNLDGILIVDDAATFIDVIESMCRILKAPREALIGTGFREFVPPERRDEGDTLFTHLKTVGTFAGEFPLRAADGSIVELEWSARAHFDRGLHFCIARDITERKGAEARRAAILETSLDAVITMDHEGRVREFNPAAERIFGYRRAEVLGQLLAELIIPPPLRECHYRGLKHYLATGEATVLGQRLELTAIRADGSEFPVELSITRIPTEGPPLFTGYLRDISDQKRAEEEKDRLLAELREASRRKDAFLAMLGHELRNPLGAITNALALLQSAKTTGPARQRATVIIERQLQHQARLVADLLDVSRIARGKFPLQQERLDLTQLVRETAEDHRSALDQANLKLDLELPNTPVHAVGDPTRLSQVLRNLLTNAIKFTDPGGTVMVRVAPVVGAARAQVTVRDTGIGIEPEMLPHVFDTFAQAAHSQERSRGGLGLGLALVKGLVELHGGEVSAKSGGLGHGAEFTLFLPLAESSKSVERTATG